MNIPVKYMASFKRAAGGRSGVQLGSYWAMMAGRPDLAELLDRNISLYMLVGKERRKEAQWRSRSWSQ
jgi:hypothetical protein